MLDELWRLRSLRIVLTCEKVCGGEESGGGERERENVQL